MNNDLPIEQYLSSILDRPANFQNVDLPSDAADHIAAAIEKKSNCRVTHFLWDAIGKTEELDRVAVPAARENFVNVTMAVIDGVAARLKEQQATQFEVAFKVCKWDGAPSQNFFGDFIIVGVRYLR
jgi:hypothetical protein